MKTLPPSVELAIQELSRLPGIGRRGAERIVTHLLDAPRDQARALGRALDAVATKIHACAECGNWAEAELCGVCLDPQRDPTRLCVIERPTDLLAFEQSGAFAGRYHVLGGTLSPLHGIGPEDLNIERLVERARTQGVREVIIATSPTVEGDATAHYLARELAPLGIETARIGLGLPLGASLGYADAGTLKLALDGRRRLDG